MGCWALLFFTLRDGAGVAVGIFVGLVVVSPNTADEEVFFACAFVGVIVGVLVAATLTVGVGVAVLAGFGVDVAAGFDVGVGVGVFVGVGTFVGVGDGVGVGVTVGTGVAVLLVDPFVCEENTVKVLPPSFCLPPD